MLFEIKRVIVGQDRLVERMLVALLARGHVLLEGVPGVAKTLAVETLATAVGGKFARLQFTPDLVPADIIGTRIYKAGQDAFDVELGPVFANFVLTDEINRAPAKVQSALLEVMAERQVSIGGVTHPLPDPFLVLATQNPIESEGVYPLPEAQRDRFLMKVLVDYPSPEEEREIVYRMGSEPPVAETVLGPDELRRLQHTASQVFVHHALVDYVVRLVVATRTPREHGMEDVATWVSYGASPRASLGLIAAAAPSRWSAAATTSCRRTSSTSPPTCSGTAWCSPTTRWPTACRPTTSSSASCRRCRCRRSRRGRTPAASAPARPAARTCRSSAPRHGPSAQQPHAHGGPGSSGAPASNGHAPGPHPA